MWVSQNSGWRYLSFHFRKPPYGDDEYPYTAGGIAKAPDLTASPFYDGNYISLRRRMEGRNPHAVATIDIEKFYDRNLMDRDEYTFILSIAVKDQGQRHCVSQLQC